MNESETKTQRGAGALQRDPSKTEGQIHDEVLAGLRQKIRSIREGHATGGYCDTAALHVEEKKLDAILRTDLEAAKEGSIEQRNIKRELASLSYRPRLVVAQD